VIIIKLWFSAAFYPTTTSSFLEIDGSTCPIIAARLSPLFLKELWVKTSVHRTSGTILATSWNKVKYFSPPYCFTQVREYNTRTNPLPLLHAGEEDPFPLLHTGERVFIGSLGMENLTQHLIPPRVFKKGKTLSTCIGLELQIANKTHTISSCMENEFPSKPINLPNNTFKQRTQRMTFIQTQA